MTVRFDFEDLFRTDVPEEWAGHIAYTVSSLIRASRLALENDTSGLGNDNETKHSVAHVLEIAEALNSVVIGGTDRLHIQCGMGVYKKEAAA